jgi:phosphosulfolactate synthase
MSEIRQSISLIGREGKPRDKGLTIVSDSLEPIEKGFLEQLAESIDYVKIGLSLPLVLDRNFLREKVRNYHDSGIKVMSGGTLLQVAIRKNILSQVLENLKSLGFDMVEISESAFEIPQELKKEITAKIDSLSMEYLFEVGTKDPKNSISASHIISKIEEAFSLKANKVVIEAGDGRGVGIYDSNGNTSWDLLNDLVGKFGPPNLIFEAPIKSQRTNLILEFGPGVNIASVHLDEVIYLEMQRLGLTTETLGLSPSLRNVEGSPAVKFVYHLIKTEHPIDQTVLMQKSGLPKRTLQAALSYLIEQGAIRELSDMSDLRKHKYSPR